MSKNRAEKTSEITYKCKTRIKYKGINGNTRIETCDKNTKVSNSNVSLKFT